jgi:hypothetical protein
VNGLAFMTMTPSASMRAKISAVFFQAATVLHQDSLGGRGEETESQALEDGAVIRLGEDFYVGEAALGGLGDEAGDERDGQAGGTRGPGNGDAFDHVAVKPAAGEDAAFPVLHGHI